MGCSTTDGGTPTSSSGTPRIEGGPALGTLGGDTCASALADGGTATDPTCTIFRVALLRSYLVTSLHEYGSSLAGAEKPRDVQVESPAAANPSATSRLSDLRAGLSTEVALALENASSSEAIVAIRRAQVEALLDVIHAYENALGVDSGELTTEWNVLADGELAALRDRARSDMVALETVTNRFADAERPLQLEIRRTEIASWLHALDQEIAARKSGKRATLRQIKDGISVRKAISNHSAIEAVEPPGKVLSKKLRIQIELRSFYAPKDAGLETLLRKVKSEGSKSSRADSVFARVEANHAARPPPNDPGMPPEPDSPQPANDPKPSPPGSGGGGGARAPPQVAEDVRLAAWDELEAVKLRDSVKIAQARARSTTGTAWLKAAFGSAGTDIHRFTPHTSEALADLRTEYVDWMKALHIEQTATPNDMGSMIEIEDARITIGDIEHELKKRHILYENAEKAVRYPEDIIRTPPVPEQSSALNVRDRWYQVDLAQEEIVQLERQMNRYRTVPDQRLLPAQRAAIRARLTAAAKVLRFAWDEVDVAKRKAFLDGRGREGAKYGEKVVDSGNAVVDAISALRSEANRYASSDPASAEMIRDVMTTLDVAPAARDRKPSTVVTSLEATMAQVRQVALMNSPEIQQTPTISFLSNSGGVIDKPRFEILSPPRDSPNVKTTAILTKPAGYAELFPEGEHWTREHRAVVSDLHRAPGGIVVDVKLPPGLATRITEARIDAKTGLLRVRIDSAWVRVEPSVDAATARACWGFIIDGRVPAADIRPLALPELEWLILTYSPVPLEQLTRSEGKSLLNHFQLLTSANLHPALVNTSIGIDMLLADMVIFDLLPSNLVLVEGDDEKAGIKLKPLWTQFRHDHDALDKHPNANKFLFTKSLISISQASSTLRNGSLILDVTIAPELFAMPVEGADVKPLLLEKTTHWLEQHAAELERHIPALRRLIRFAATAAIFKTISEKRIPNNFDVLAAVESPYVLTPRFLCRSGDSKRCDRRTIAHNLGIENNDDARGGQ